MYCFTPGLSKGPGALSDLASRVQLIACVTEASAPSILKKSKGAAGLLIFNPLLELVVPGRRLGLHGSTINRFGTRW